MNNNQIKFTKINKINDDLFTKKPIKISWLKYNKLSTISLCFRNLKIVIKPIKERIGDILYIKSNNFSFLKNTLIKPMLITGINKIKVK